MSTFVERFRASRPNNSPLKPLQADDSFTYVVGRGVTCWPTINGNQAAFAEEDFGQTRGLKQFIGTEQDFRFGLVNAHHSVGPGKSNTVLGSVRDNAWVESPEGNGVDILGQIDKRACEAYSVEPDDFVEEGGLNSFSIEIHCDRSRSTFVAMTNPASKKLEDQTIFTAEEAAQQGIRRTSWVEPDPYLYEGKHLVVELCSPIRCRGVAVLPDPAEKTANVYEVAAGLEMAEKKKLGEPYGSDVDYGDPGYRGDKKRYPLDTEEHVRAAASYFGQQSNRDKYTPEQQKHIQSKIDAAKKKFGIGDEEKSSFASTDTPSITPTSSFYDSIEPLDIDAAQHSDMPNEAFADHYFDPDEVADKRAYPLYPSAKHFVEAKPHAGLVKAALQAHADGKLNNPQMALKRLQVAHSQLHGANIPMTDEEKAALESKLSEVQAALAGKDTVITEKDTEIAALKAQLAQVSEEKASLEDTIKNRDAEEKANQRLAKLTAIEGYAVKDEEKASLIESLKSEDEVAFENRVLKAQIASMEEAAKKAKPKMNDNDKDDEEKAALISAAADANIDIFPTGNVSGKTSIFDLM